MFAEKMKIVILNFLTFSSLKFSLFNNQVASMRKEVENPMNETAAKTDLLIFSKYLLYNVI
jgi:hypothetical protein